MLGRLSLPLAGGCLLLLGLVSSARAQVAMAQPAAPGSLKITVKVHACSSGGCTSAVCRLMATTRFSSKVGPAKPAWANHCLSLGGSL